MPVDTSIYNNIKQFRLDDPIETQTKAYALADAKRKFTIDDDISQAAQQTGGDPSSMSSALMQKGHYAPAMQIRSQAAAQSKSEIDQRLKTAEAVASDSIALDAAFRNAMTQAGGDREKAIAAMQTIYAPVREKAVLLGHKLPDRFNPDMNFAAMGQAKEVVAYLKSIAPDVKMTDTGGAITPTNTNPLAGPVGPMAGANPIPKTAAPGSPTELKRLMTERDALPEGDPRRTQYDRTINSYKAGRGDTNVQVNTGPMTPGKTAAGKVDEGLLDTTKGLMQLDQISSQFKPEYQTLSTRGEQWWSSTKEKLGANLTNKEKRDLTEFSQFKRNSIDSLNQYIKSVTGAAMTNAEAERILKGLPNPGSGLTDGDSPTEFKAKLDDAIKQTKMSVARLAYIKRNGMSLEDGNGNPVLSLDRMPTLINERGSEVEAQLKSNGGKDGPALQKAVRRQLSLEFGLSAD